MIRRPSTTLAALVAGAALLLAACSSGSATPAAATAGASQAASGGSAAAACSVVDGSGTAAEIKGFAFPTGLTVKAGGSISWTNGDTAPHTVTFDDGTCSTQVAPGTTVTVQYTTAGTHPFHCSVHPNMKSSLDVSG